MPHHPRSVRALGAAAALLIAAGLTSCSGSDDDAGPDEGEVTEVGTGDAYAATIRRTTDGVPHITGDTLPDAAFGQGYASGEDRTCDLADQVVKVRGERARWFGPGDDDANIDSDVQWRAIGMFDRATEDWEDLAPDGQDLFEAYVAGWNAHLDEVGADGIGGWCAGEEWVRPLEPVEVYAYARSIALNASGTRIGALIPSAAPPGDAGGDGPSNAAGPTASTSGSGGSADAPGGRVPGGQRDMAFGIPSDGSAAVSVWPSELVPTPSSLARGRRGAMLAISLRSSTKATMASDWPKRPCAIPGTTPGCSRMVRSRRLWYPARCIAPWKTGPLSGSKS